MVSLAHPRTVPQRGAEIRSSPLSTPAASGVPKIFLDQAEVTIATTMSRTAIYEAMQEKRFPTPVADAASARQSALTDSFKALVFGADATAASQAKAGAAIAQTGRDAGAAAVGVGQVTQAHGAAAGAALANATAQNAAAIAAQIAGNASMDAGAKWVQLGVQLREIAAAQDQQIKNAEKLASAAKIEGDGLQALAALRGKPTGVAESNGINGPSRDWFSIVNEAISKAVIDKARENTRKPAANEGTGTMQGGLRVPNLRDVR